MSGKQEHESNPSVDSETVDESTRRTPEPADESDSPDEAINEDVLCDPTTFEVLYGTELAQIRDQVEQLLLNHPRARVLAVEAFNRVVELRKVHAAYMDGLASQPLEVGEEKHALQFALWCENAPPDPLARGRFYYSDKRDALRVEDPDDVHIAIYRLVGLADCDSPCSLLSMPPSDDEQVQWCWECRGGGLEFDWDDTEMLCLRGELNSKAVHRRMANTARRYLRWFNKRIAAANGEGSVSHVDQVQERATPAPLANRDDSRQADAGQTGVQAIDKHDLELLRFLDQSRQLRRLVSDIFPSVGPQDRKQIGRRLRALADRVPPLVDYPPKKRSGVAILPAGTELLRRLAAQMPP